MTEKHYIECDLDGCEVKQQITPAVYGVNPRMIDSCAFCQSENVPGTILPIRRVIAFDFQDLNLPVCAMCAEAYYPVVLLEYPSHEVTIRELLFAMMRVANHIARREANGTVPLPTCGGSHE